jgi:hypothetical protein
MRAVAGRSRNNHHQEVSDEPDAQESRVATPETDIQPLDDALDYLREYARQKPEMAALWCFGVGFVLGWKLKPW